LTVMTVSLLSQLVIPADESVLAYHLLSLPTV
jgi:hypothetical protein